MWRFTDFSFLLIYLNLQLQRSHSAMVVPVCHLRLLLYRLFGVGEGYLFGSRRISLVRTSLRLEEGYVLGRSGS